MITAGLEMTEVRRLLAVLTIQPITDVLPAVSSALLDSSGELFHVAFGFSQIVVSHFPPFSLDLTLELLPLA